MRHSCGRPNFGRKTESVFWGPNRSKIWSEHARPGKSIWADFAVFQSAAEVRSDRPNLFLTTFSDAVKPAVSETVSNFSRRPFWRSPALVCACKIAILPSWPPASLDIRLALAPLIFVGWPSTPYFFALEPCLPIDLVLFSFFCGHKGVYFFFFCLSSPTGKSRRFDSFQKMTCFYCLARRSVLFVC